MKKRYVVVFGVRLLGYDRLTGAWSIHPTFSTF